MKKKAIMMGLVILLIAGLMGCADTGTSGDASGDSATADASGDDSNAALEDKASLYEDEDDTSVITMYLTVTSGNSSESTNHTWSEVNSYSVYDYENMGVDRYGVNGLLQIGDESGPLEGELGYGQVTPNATVTIRGQTSSKYAQKNYKIELKDGKGTWNDQRVINLNKHQEDGLRFRNKLCYELMQDLPGMISLQTQFVHLYVKDETEGSDASYVDYGLYTQVEQPNKSFLKRHGFDKHGQLYKINEFEFFRYEDVIKLTTDSDYDETAFEELLEIKGDDDNTKLIAMLDDLNDESIPIEDVIDQYFNEDNLLSWLSFQILTGNTDTLSRNTLIYSPLNSEVWYFISWDCDDSFMRTEDELLGNSEEAGWQHGVSNYWGNVLFKRLLKSDTLRADLDKKIEQYRSLLTEEKLTELVNKYAVVTEDYAFATPDLTNEPLTQAQFKQVCEALPGEIEENYQDYKASLTEPMPFFIGTPVNNGTSYSFTWDNSYDFQEEDIFYTFELADNLNFDQPIVSQENIYTPGYEYDGTLAPGQYFIRLKATNTSGNSQYAFDYYVSDGDYKNYGVLSFYVGTDGSVEVETYEEE